MNNELVSVAILNHNGLKFLKKTLKSIKKLKYPNYEILVVDNCSDDGSLKFLKENKKIRVIKLKENYGYSKGKNICVNNSKGKYVFLLDNDILIKDLNILKYALAEYNSLENPAFLSFPMTNNYQKTTKLYSYCYGIWGPIYNKPLNLFSLKRMKSFPSGAPLGGNIFFKKKIWKDIGGYDCVQKYYLDDFDIGARSYLKGYKNYIYPRFVLDHLGYNTKINKKNWEWKFSYFFSGYARIMIKNYNLFNLSIRFPLFLIFSILKTAKYSLKFNSLNPSKSFVLSIKRFIKNIDSTIKLRKKIQSERVYAEDDFLKISPPK